MPEQTMQGLRGVVHLLDGQDIVTCSWNGSLRVWDLESGIQIGDDWRDEEGDEAGAISIALSPNGNTIASGGFDGTVKLWDVDTGKMVTKWTGHAVGVSSVSWSADGEQLVSGSWDGTARARDVQSGNTILKVHGHQYVWAVIYSPDRTRIATGGTNDNAAKIWDTKTGELLLTIKHDLTVFSLAWTLDGKKFISASGNQIRITDTTTQWEQIASLDGHWVNTISLTLNGRLLASISYDKTVHLWNLDTNLPVGPPRQLEDSVDCVTFSADGEVLVGGSSSTNRNIYLWDVRAILQEAGLEDLLSTPGVPESGKSLMDADATQAEDNQPPRDFFNDAPDGIHPSAARGTYFRSSAHPSRPRSSHWHPVLGSHRTFIDRLGWLFHRSHSNTEETTEFQQFQRRTLVSPRGPRAVEVAAVRDKKPLFVARRSARDREKAKRAQQQESQSQCQTQAASSQSPRPVAASTSTTPPAPATSTTTPDPAGTRSRRLPLWARLVLFLCCASPPHVNGH